ncbi:hypothetical protein HQ865_07555 [Mucilaginibacter mali]|uniref:Uncharacterized protein n=1 Tax=Mucilaginibacter mali TaxID=2740462 RepID=A0A7D4QED1_9SPHI|nr:hypothetical protein [Mucilaginibacter mali]QKJ29612.1 hypothetical protein HQ865_07555 [Mucilaginibacter mali]
MMLRLLLFALFIPICINAQVLKIRDRRPDALTGSQFAQSVSDTALSLKDRENIIYKAIKQGNIPNFYRKLVLITDSMKVNYQRMVISYYVLPDYIAIGTDADYFYCPMTPGLAQRVANKLKCSLPTRQLSDTIYQYAQIKLSPLPIPPTQAMTTMPIFIRHNQMVRSQLDSLGNRYTQGNLTAGDKKDVIISNRIYNDTSAYHVVIYGWHRLNGKAIQLVYAKHLNTWADYSHGIRLIQRDVWVNGKKMDIRKVLSSPTLNVLLSDEGPINKPYYPAKKFLNLF